MSRILVIDDDADYARVLLRHVEEMGHEGASAACREDGARLAETFEPDVVLLDVGLPDGSGLDAIRRIKGMRSCPEVVILTGRAEPAGAELAIRSGAWDYLRKGGPLSDLSLVLTNALDFRCHRMAAAVRALDPGPIVAGGRAMKECFDRLAQAAGSEANVLISGETGTGKELCARVVHANSRRCRNDFVVVDCATLPENLVESMLFGHVRGAFTGAVEKRIGLVEQADGGTLFLDEVGEMPLAIQKAFLRILEERRVRPIGGDREIPSDFRLVAATNRDLGRMVEAGHFRQDLFFRLGGISIHLPPLRERGEDLREITNVVVARICGRESLGTKGISPEFYEAVAHYPWPGNVRELIHALDQAVAAARQHPTLYRMHLPTEIRVHLAKAGVEPRAAALASPYPAERSLTSLRDFRWAATRGYLADLVAVAAGDMDEATRICGVSRGHLYALLKEHAVARTEPPPGVPAPASDPEVVGAPHCPSEPPVRFS